MGNVIYDIAPGAVINPFVGAGIGINHVKVDTVGQFSSVTGAFSGASAVLTTSARPSGRNSTPTRHDPGGVPATAAAIAPSGDGKPSSAAEAETRA